MSSQRSTSYFAYEATQQEEDPEETPKTQSSQSGGLFYDDDGVVHELAMPTATPPAVR